MHLKCQYRQNFYFPIWSDFSCSELLWKNFSIWIKSDFFSNISKTSARVSSGFQTRETFETMRTQAEWFYCFRVVGNLMKPETRIFEITCPSKKIILNYHLNKFSQFNYCIWDVICAWSLKKCAWSYHIVPNCCAMTIFEYSSTDVTLLRSCLSILSVHGASQCKWQSADLELLKLTKKRKTVWPALFRGSLIKFLTSVPF